jgi:hypothetical protein
VNPAELATRGPVLAATTGAAWALASSGVLICGVVSLLLVSGTRGPRSRPGAASCSAQASWAGTRRSPARSPSSAEPGLRRRDISER